MKSTETMSEVIESAETGPVKDKKQTAADKKSESIASVTGTTKEKALAKEKTPAVEVKPVENSALYAVGQTIAVSCPLRVYESSVAVRPAFLHNGSATIADGSIHQGRIRVMLNDTKGLKNCWVNAGELTK